MAAATATKATAKIANGVLTVTIPLEKDPEESTSGKTKVVATTGGFKLQADEQYMGKTVSVSLNATIPNKDKK